NGKTPMGKVKQTPLIWNKEAETMPRDQLEKLQLQRLQQTVELVYNQVPFYKQSFDERGVKPCDIKSLQDIRKLPFTTKQNLRDNYPFGMLTVPVEKLVRLHASSGTTGKPTIGPYTAKDLDIWAELMARFYTAAGATWKDVIHNAFGYGLFTGGLGFHLGAERIGATVVPISAGLSKRQIMLMEDFGATVLNCTPSYALVLAESAIEMGVNISQRMQVRIGFFGAEPWTEEMRQEIEAKLNLESFDNYGLTEMGGPGVSVECPYHDGLHIAEDHFLAELVDPDSGEPVGEGKVGELVLTALTREAMPLLRYRSRDRVTLNREKCACGRTMARMSKVKGRTDDMLIIRGVNVFPSSIESVLLSADDVEPHYLLIIDRPKDKLDSLEVWVEASDDLWKRGEYWVKQTEQRIYNDLNETLGLAAKVKVNEPHSIQRSEGKAKRIIDRRDLGG
ncbi:partial phenylacetate-CoA ligase, partial [Anaerolineae bacterium]